MPKGLLFLIIVLCHLGQQAHAAAWKANGVTGVQFTINFSSSSVEYMGHHLTVKFERRTCNEIILKNLTNNLMNSLKEKGVMAPDSPLKLIIDGQTSSVSIQSRLGSLLIGMEDEIRRMKLAEELSCKG